MTVSTKLFADTMLKRFDTLNEEIQLRQTKVSTGKEITQASEKPLEAVQLSALVEHSTQMESFQRNVKTAQDRLALGDTVLQEADAIFVRLREQAIAANNDTFAASDLEAIGIEVGQLREALLGLANTRSSDGQALFGGYATDIIPYQQGEDGRVKYLGDGGEHTLAVSESMRLPTSVNGGEVFMQVQTENGSQSIFDIVDSFEAALLTHSGTKDIVTAQAEGGMTLRINGDRVPREWSFDLSGPDGTTTIVAKGVVGGSSERVLEAINAASDVTGVTASVVNGQLQLNSASGEIKLSNLAVEGVDRAEREPTFTMSVGTDPVETFAPKIQSLEAQLSKIVAGGTDIAISRTTVGARLLRAETQEDVLRTRSVSLDIRINELSSADLEQVITEMKTLMLTQSAARQAYSQIGQTSLFDYLK